PTRTTPPCVGCKIESPSRTSRYVAERKPLGTFTTVGFSDSAASSSSGGSSVSADLTHLHRRGIHSDEPQELSEKTNPSPLHFGQVRRHVSVNEVLIRARALL